MKACQRIILAALSLLVCGCSEYAVDYCGLLTMDQVRTVHPDAVSADMEKWYASTDHPTWYCTWKNSDGENRLSLNASFATTNASRDIIRTYSDGSRVAEVAGVGKDAAAMFYKSNDGNGERVTLFARDDKWTLDVRSSIAGNESGEQFKKLKELVNRTFGNLRTDEQFASLHR